MSGRSIFAKNGARAVLLGVLGVATAGVVLASLPHSSGHQPAAASTGPVPAPAAGVSFIAFGDAGQGSKQQYAVRDQMRRLASTYQFGLLLGDGAYPNGTVADYRARFFPVYRGLFQGEGQPPPAPTTGLPKPLFTTTGSHDYYGTPNAAAYRSVFDMPLNGPAGQEDYSFNVGPVHFLTFDSAYLTDPSTPAIDVSAVERWMIADLDRYGDRVTVVFDHDPAYTGGQFEHAPEVLQVRRTFFAIAAAHGADLFLSGHEHAYERNRPESGLTSYIAGGGGGQIQSAGPDAAVQPPGVAMASLAYYGFLEVRVSGCRISTDYRRSDGSIFDPWTYRAPTCDASAASTPAPPVQPASPTGHTVFRDTFGSGSLGRWTVQAAAGGMVTVAAAPRGEPGRAAILAETSEPGSVAFARVATPPGARDLSVSLAIDVLEAGRTGSNVPLVTLLGPGGTDLVQVYRQNVTSGKVYVEVPGPRYLVTRGMLSLGTWMQLTVHVHLARSGSEVDVHADGYGIFEATSLDLGNALGGIQIGNDVAAQRFHIAVSNVEVTAP
ncbi:MAG: metallophosphoesterase [Chloroflexi bacterium]|nr:metallophosphoesterase [Chloroflexota bacterium]